MIRYLSIQITCALYCNIIMTRCARRFDKVCKILKKFITVKQLRQQAIGRDGSSVTGGSSVTVGFNLTRRVQ
jgi:hypothetical protein